MSYDFSKPEDIESFNKAMMEAARELSRVTTMSIGEAAEQIKLALTSVSEEATAQISITKMDECIKEMTIAPLPPSKNEFISRKINKNKPHWQR